MEVRTRRWSETEERGRLCAHTNTRSLWTKQKDDDITTNFILFVRSCVPHPLSPLPPTSHTHTCIRRRNTTTAVAPWVNEPRSSIHTQYSESGNRGYRRARGRQREEIKKKEGRGRMARREERKGEEPRLRRRRLLRLRLRLRLRRSIRRTTGRWLLLRLVLLRGPDTTTALCGL